VFASIPVAVMSAAVLCAWAIAHGASSTWRMPFLLLCHGIPHRCYTLWHTPLPICARCTGLYAGFAFTLLIYPLVRSLRSVAIPPRRILFLAAVPLLIDFSLTFFGIWENTHTSRLLTGALLGSVVVFYVMPGIADLSLRGLRLSTPRPPTFTLASPESIAAAPSDYSAPERRI